MAQITPILKKPGLDVDDPASYRPISNLNTISKILKRLFLARLAPQICKSPCYNIFQSAYRKFHKTETALLKLLNDVYHAIDGRKITVLIALDLSAAFDTLDHTTILLRLQRSFGITGSALSWLTTYLDGRLQFVKVGVARSSTLRSFFGVPQGSVLGPNLFSCYVAPIARLISSFGVQFHQYADDTQLYIGVWPANVAVTADILERCTTALEDWFDHMNHTWYSNTLVEEPNSMFGGIQPRHFEILKCHGSRRVGTIFFSYYYLVIIFDMAIIKISLGLFWIFIRNSNVIYSPKNQILSYVHKIFFLFYVHPLVILVYMSKFTEFGPATVINQIWCLPSRYACGTFWTIWLVHGSLFLEKRYFISSISYHSQVVELVRK